MLLSIIVPVYNVKDYVIKCLESIYLQTLHDYEVIVVDDGSTDGSGELVDKYCRDKKQFHVFHEPNGGLMSAWMGGVEHATGDYIGFVDSDDYVHETMFQKLTDIAVEHNCDIVMCDHYSVGQTATVRGHHIRPGLYTGEQMEEINQVSLPRFIDPYFMNARWAKVFKREIILINTKYCEHRSRLIEDRFITPACLFSAKSFYYLNEPLYYYVARPGSNWRHSSTDLQDAFELLTATQKQMLKDKGLFEKYGNLVDRANLHYLQVMIIRNFSGGKWIKNRKVVFERWKMAKRILKSQYYRACVHAYRNDLTGINGFLIIMSFKINGPLLFVFIFSSSCAKLIHVFARAIPKSYRSQLSQLFSRTALNKR